MSRQANAAHPAFCSIGNGVHFLRRKADQLNEDDLSPSSSVETAKTLFPLPHTPSRSAKRNLHLKFVCTIEGVLVYTESYNTLKIPHCKYIRQYHLQTLLNQLPFLYRLSFHDVPVCENVPTDGDFLSDRRCRAVGYDKLESCIVCQQQMITYPILTPCSTVLLEKLTGSQTVKKFPAFYGTRRFSTAFTEALHLSLS